MSRMLSLEPGGRYASASALIDAFEPLRKSLEAPRMTETPEQAGAVKGLYQARAYWKDLDVPSKAMRVLDVAESMEVAEDALASALDGADFAGAYRQRATLERFGEFMRCLKGEPLTEARCEPALLEPLHQRLVAIFHNDRQALASFDPGSDGLFDTSRPDSYIAGIACFANCMTRIARIAIAGSGEGAGVETANAGAFLALTADARHLGAFAMMQPESFGHLHDLVLARLAELEGRYWDAARHFETAMAGARDHLRPWHMSLILESAGIFHLTNALESTARDLLRRAVTAYQRWGAQDKLQKLGEAYPFLAGIQPLLADETPAPRWIFTVADRQAMLDASQALSSETDFQRLVTRMLEVLERLAGATAAALFFNDERDGWLLAGARRNGTDVGNVPLPIESAEQYGIPGSIIRHALDTESAELIGNAAFDARFAGEPLLHDVDCCSVLLVPIMSKGSMRACLYLENRLSSGFFTGKDLDTLGLIASTLSTSIENALLYRSLEDRVAQRTFELERASSELELRERALERTTNGVMICEARDGFAPIIYVNAMFETITGYSSAEVLGLDPRFLQGADALQAESDELACALAERQSCHVVLRNYRRDGAMFYSDVSVAPFNGPDGTVTHFVGVLVDVTDRLRMEALEHSKSERLRAVFELSPDGFVVVDKDDRINLVNRAFERMTGLRAEALIGQSRATLEALLVERGQPKPSDHESGNDFEDTSLGGGVRRPTPRRAVERTGLMRIRKPQPRTLMRRVRRGESAGLETVMYFRDVTREMEIDQMKSDFLSTAAHELRTPMTSIFGFTELVLKRKLDDEQRVDMLQAIHRQSASLVTLINELLDLARIEARRGADFHYQLQLLEPIIVQTVAALVLVGDDRKVQLIGTKAPRWVNVDAEKLSNALTNLLSNAFKYSTKGAITIEFVERENRNRAELGIRVSDEGIGMTPQQLTRLFDRFFRAESSGRTPGTGLGTTIAKEIVLLHDGELTAESRYGVGTQMTIWLPLYQAPDTETIRSRAATKSLPATQLKLRRKR